MKAGWSETTLGEVCEVLDRLRKPITKKDRVEGPIPYYGATGIVDYVEGFIFDEPLVLVGEDGAKWDGGEATAFAVDGKTWVNNHAHVLRPDRKFLTDEWLIFWLTFSDLSEFVTGVTVPKLNQKNLRSIKLPLPPLKEQKQIVAVLDEAFAALDRTHENVDANLSDARSLHMSIKANILDVDIDAQPLARAIGEVATGPFGSLLHKSDYVEGGVPLVNPSHIQNSKIKHDPRKTVLQETADRLSAYKLNEGDIVIGRRGEMGRCAVVEAENEGWLCGTGSFVIRTRDLELAKYSVEYLSSSKQVERLENIAGGATMPNLSNKALSGLLVKIPNRKYREAVTAKLNQVSEICDSLVQEQKKRIVNLTVLRQSLLQRAFAGELTQIAPTIAVNDNERHERLSTATLVLAFDKHLIEQRQNTFGHVKAQKSLHLTESIGGLDLGRRPQVWQAGPHDQEHFARVEAWAKKNGIFEFKQRRSGGYTFNSGKNYNAFLSEAKTLLADYQAGLSRFLPLMVDMNTQEAEVFTTVHAAWNNLLADSKTPSDDDIVTAARENWHESKTKIDRQLFVDAIRKIRRHDLEPDGTAKYVRGAQESLI